MMSESLEAYLNCVLFWIVFVFESLEAYLFFKQGCSKTTDLDSEELLVGAIGFSCSSHFTLYFGFSLLLLYQFLKFEHSFYLFWIFCFVLYFLLFFFLFHCVIGYMDVSCFYGSHWWLWHFAWMVLSAKGSNDVPDIKERDNKGYGDWERKEISTNKLGKKD